MIIRTVVIHYDHGYSVYYNYIVSHYFIEVRLASLVDTDTPRNRADEEERVKANALLSLGLVTACVLRIYGQRTIVAVDHTRNWQ